MSTLRDFQYAARRLAHDWRFTLAAAFTLSLGIGANATVFTIVNALMLRELPFADHDRVIAIGSQDKQGRRFGVSFRDFEDWRDHAATLTGMAMWGSYTWNVSDPGRDPDRYWGAYISGNVFQLMGQKPLLGRDFLADDDKPGAPPVVIFSHNVWQNRYGSDPAILGRVVKVSEIPATVIGVMPTGMNFPPNTDAWMPLVLMPPAVRNMNRNARNYAALARLADGATLERSRAELTSIADGLTKAYPDTNKDIVPRVVTFAEEMNGGDGPRILQLLMGAVGFVLLIACANVANLLLGRSANRTREVGVRLAIGSPRWRIVRQLLIESVLLAFVGGAIGVWIGYAALRVFVASLGNDWPFWVKFTMDAKVFAFIGAVCLGTALLFGLAPALYVSKTDVNSVLKEGGRTGSSGGRTGRWAGSLIMAELVLTLVLLSGAGLMMRSFLAIYARDSGFNASNLLVMSLSLPGRKYPTAESRAVFYGRLEERLKAIPAVQAGTVASHTPFGGSGSLPLVVDGRDATADKEPLSVSVVAIGPGYFDGLGVHVLRGRALAAADGQIGQEHIVVNQDFVTRYLSTRDPIGHRIRLGSPAGPLPAGSPQAPPPAVPWQTIVGVAPNVRQRNVQNQTAELQPIVYLPHRTQSYLFARLIVRTTIAVASIAPLVRAELRTIDSDIPIVDMMTMNDQLSLQRRDFAVIGTMFTVFAFVALVLSAVGLYAVTAHAVVQRTQEIGIRMALGAEARQVRWLFLEKLAVYLGVGLALGLAGSVGVGMLMRNILFGIGPYDPATLIATAAVLSLVAAAACFWPARRATRVDPMVALRYQ